MNKYIIASILTLILVFSGCVQTEGKTVYHSEKYNNNITLYNDFTATYISQKESWAGTYKIDDDKIILILAPFGSVSEYTKQGDRLVMSDGDFWVKI